MNPELLNVASHMKELALGSLTLALYNTLFHSYENAWTSELAVLNTAHAGELLIKARIAQEHPLLIFADIPKLKKDRTGALSFDDLFHNGKTIQFAELPDRLWATTGIQLANRKRFEEFGRLRNAIQHFAASKEIDTTQACLDFVFEVLDPFMNREWGLFAIDFNEDSDHYEYVLPTLVSRNIRPLLSPSAGQIWSDSRFRPGDDAPPGYIQWFDKALAGMATCSTEVERSRDGNP